MSTDPRLRRPLIHEVKFPLPAGEAALVRRWARAHMVADPNAGAGGEYTVTTLYLDTPDRDVYLRNGSNGRVKYRLRRYDERDWIYVERKLKREGLVGKQRSVVHSFDLDRFEAVPDPNENWPGAWFHRRIAARGLRPVCLVRYHRVARTAQGPEGALRLTIDTGLEACAASRFSLLPSAPMADLGDGMEVLELKFPGEMPTLFKELLYSYRLEAAKSSKYRRAVDALGLQEGASCLAS